MSDAWRYIRWVAGIELRPYQKEPLRRIMESIEQHLGDTIVLVFPRQSGKDELLVQVTAYLLHCYAVLPVGIVMVNPTYRPQTITALERLDRTLAQNRIARKKWRKRGQLMRKIGQATVSFVSGATTANTRGASASLLLIVNEAQDIKPSIYGKVLEPMTASTNATRILCGTVWTSDTLLAREIRAARQAEKADGRKRVFMVDATEVSETVEQYGEHVEAAIRKYGREHPFVKTQYFNEEIDARGGMFTAAQRAMMNGGPSPELSPTGGAEREEEPSSQEDAKKGSLYAFLIDVAGQEEASMSGRARLDGEEPEANEKRDATTLRIVEIDLSTMETLQAPTYRAVHLQQWTGQNHLTVFGQLKALAEAWRPQHIVIDATGVGEGVWAMLDKAFPTRVTPVKFSQSVKSELGYGFLAIINTGRFRDYCGSDPHPFPFTQGETGNAAGIYPTREQIDREYAACECEILPGPQKTMRWGVPEGRRDADGQAIHDDIPVTDSLTAILDKMRWAVRFEPFIIPGKDPLEEMSRWGLDS